MSRKTMAYFFPIAWRFQKSYFIVGATKAVLEAIHPFISILMLPLIIDELLGERRLDQLFTYVAIIVIVGSLISLMRCVLTSSGT